MMISGYETESRIAAWVPAQRPRATNRPCGVPARWKRQRSSEQKCPRTAQSFCVPKADIAAKGYDLSLNRYKEVVHEEVNHRSPKEILAELAKIEKEIQQGMKDLMEMVN